MKTAGNVLVVVLLVMSMVVVATGCLQQFWPTSQVSPLIVDYTKSDPNNFKFPITTLGKVERLKHKAAGIHLVDQISLKAEMDKNEGLNSLVMGEMNIIIQRAQEQYESAVGTVASPGWLSLLVLGGGGGLLGRKLTQLTHYSEQEYQAGISKAKS